MNEEVTQILRYAGTGALSGMRTMAGPTLVSARLDRAYVHNDSGAVDVLDSTAISRTLKVLAAVEIVLDKMPFVGRRTVAPSLAFRSLAGGFAGAALSSADRRGWLTGAVVGATAAVAGAFVAYRARRAAHHSFGIPDPLLGLVEDALVYAGGRALVKRAM